MKDHTIIHHEFINFDQGQFTTIPNSLIRDPNLRAEAKFYLILMLSNQTGWAINPHQMEGCSLNGIHTVYNAISELKEAGYVGLFKHYHDDNVSYKYCASSRPMFLNLEKDKKGTMKMTWVEFQSRVKPPITENPITENPITENPITENPITENHYNKNNNSKEYQLNKNTNIPYSPLLGDEEKGFKAMERQQAKPKSRKPNPLKVNPYPHIPLTIVNELRRKGDLDEGMMIWLNDEKRWQGVVGIIKGYAGPRGETKTSLQALWEAANVIGLKEFDERIPYLVAASRIAKQLHIQRKGDDKFMVGFEKWIKGSQSTEDTKYCHTRMKAIEQVEAELVTTDKYLRGMKLERRQKLYSELYMTTPELTINEQKKDNYEQMQ